MIFGTPVEATGFSTSLTFNLTSVPTGSTVVAWVYGQGAAGATQSVSDGSNTYSQQTVNLQTGNNSMASTYTHVYSGAQASLTLTATSTVSSMLYFGGFWVTSPGVTGTPNNTFNTFPGTGADIVVTGTTTTTVNGAYIIGIAESTTASSLSSGTTPNAFTTIPLTFTSAWLEYFTQTTAGAIQATFGASANENTHAAVIALQPPSGGGTNSAAIAWVS